MGTLSSASQGLLRTLVGTSLLTRPGILRTLSGCNTCLTRHTHYIQLKVHSRPRKAYFVPPPVGTSHTASQGLLLTPSEYLTLCLARHTSHPEWVSQLLPHKACLARHIPQHSGHIIFCLARHTPYTQWVHYSLPRKAYPTLQVGTLLIASRGILPTQVGTLFPASQGILHTPSG